MKSLVKSALGAVESSINWALKKSSGRIMTKEFSSRILSAYTEDAAPSHANSVFSKALKDSATDKSDFFAHLSLGNIPGNAGDILITHLQKVVWEKAIGQGVLWYDAYPDIKARTNHEFILRSKCIVVGPGGLISGAPYSNGSGWFLDLDHQFFENQESPIVVFGAGVNRWKHKRLFTDQALANIEKFFDRCSWIGLRETAGIQFLTDKLGKTFEDKLIFQPCPSLMLGELVPETPHWESRFVSVNIAADQLVELPIDRAQVAGIYTKLLQHLVDRNLIPIIWCASSVDQEFAQKFFPQYQTLLLSGFSGGQIPHVVRMFRFAIGTRMHSVFPFIGMGIPAIATFGFQIRSSVMRDDLGLGNWLCEWSESDRDWDKAADELIDKTDCVNDQISEQRSLARDTAKRMSKLTRENLERLLTGLSLKATGSPAHST